MIATGCDNWVINPAHIREIEYHDYPDYTLYNGESNDEYGLMVTFSNGDVIYFSDIEDIELILAQYPHETFRRNETLQKLRNREHPLQLYLNKN
jgi:hypothetical protein